MNTKPTTTDKKELHNPLKKKLIIFTYFGKDTRMITKLFRNTELGIALRTENTIKQHLGIKEKITDKYNLSGVYIMNCKDCPQKYVGQIGCTFRTRYKEHIRETKTNGNTSKYAQHILDKTHYYDNTEETMKILHVTKKGKMLDTLENYYIYKITKVGIQINDVATNTYNPIYECINEHTKTDPI
jgi:hypothetical protein